MKLVGMNGLAVSVPERWRVRVSQCGGQGPSSLLAESPRRARLVVDSVCISDTRPSLDAIKTTEHIEVNDLAVMEDKGPHCADGLCSLNFFVPSEHVAFSVGINVDGGYPRPGALEAIRDSVQLLPDGYTTIPPIAPGTVNHRVANFLLDAGLRPRQGKGAGLDFEPGGWSAKVPVTTIEPSAGSVVPKGSVVTFHVKSMGRQVEE